MSGDLFELLFVLAFILFGILGGRKKKGAGQRQLPQPRPRPRPAPRPAPDRSMAGRTAQRPPSAPRTTQDALLQELEGLLTGRPVRGEPVPVASPMGDTPDPDEARSLESLEDETSARWEEGLERATESAESAGWSAGRDRGQESLETLEEAGGASHVRFHSLYDRQPDAPPRPTQRAVFRNADVRRAVIWSEILGPPVSER
jgi:hypothetical protein